MKYILFYIWLFIGTANLWAQDPQYSQYYANPMYLNPAFAGTGECYRIGTQARSQWTGLHRAFNTINIYADLNYSDINSGIGIMLIRDQVGTPRLTTNEIHGLYSYHLDLGNHYHLDMGLEAAYLRRSIEYQNVYFEDQYEDTEITYSASGDPVTSLGSVGFADFSSGLLFYKDNAFWIGASLHHINEPNTGFLYNSKLPIKFSVHGGYKISLKHYTGLSVDHAYKLTPSFNYKRQNNFDQLDMGLYVLRDQLLLGLWYRGLIFKKDNSIRNSDAISLQVGLKVEKFSLIYSYDITTSRLGQSNTFGSHEISLQYRFCANWPTQTRPAKPKKLPCPDFR